MSCNAMICTRALSVRYDTTSRVQQTNISIQISYEFPLTLWKVLNKRELC